MRRFSASLVFVYSQATDGVMRLMERRIVSVEAASAEEAYAAVMQLGKDGEVRKDRRTGTNFSLDFMGVQEMIELGLEASPHEVWHELSRVKWPLVSKNAVRRKDDLAVFTSDRRRMR